jgi:hypothetical protein
MSENLYDPNGDVRLTPQEVCILKNIARAGIMVRFIVAVLIGLTSLVVGITELIERFAHR